MYHKVKCILGGEPNIRSNVNGSKLAIEIPATNNKQYDFLYDDSKFELVPGDLVVCQVRSSFTFGIVVAIPDEPQIDAWDYMRNVVLEEGSHKLVIAKLDLAPVHEAVRVKALYRKRERELAAQSKLNNDAFEFALKQGVIENG